MTETKKHRNNNYHRTASWGGGLLSVKYNDFYEVEGMTEIKTRYPSEYSINLNDEQRQEAADKNNNGKLGKAYRYKLLEEQEWYVDLEAKVFWKQDYR